jgi:hypothetical protein
MAMEYSVVYNPELKIVIVEVDGLLTPENCKAMDEESVRLAHKNNTSLFLTDLRQAEVMGPAVDIYELPGQLCSKLTGRGYKHALISRQVSEPLRFFETVARNRGCRVRIFSGEAKAMKWLKK